MKPIAQYVDDLADRLVRTGHLTDPKWREPLHGVPRHLFAPAVAWVDPADGPNRRLDRIDDEAAWLGAVYSETSIITQLDDGVTPLEEGGDGYTSSLSAPGVVLVFLQHLDLQDGDRVLEIGTGTGWTAGLLSARVGAENVTSIEIDPDVLKQAEKNLELAGCFPRLILGDGALGASDGAPYDRVHVTCGVREVPFEWVRQTRSGGRIAFPWVPGWCYGHQALLTVTGVGTAIGRFPGDAGYMMLRSQRFEHYAPPATDRTEVTATRLDPRKVARESYGCDVAISGLLPGVTSVEEELEDGSFGLHVRDPDGSWAIATYQPGGDSHRVEQAGERRLWTEVETAFLRWVSWGSPARARFGMTVTPEGQYIWLDQPDKPIR